MNVNNTSLLTFGKELHSISLRDCPTTHSNNKSANYNKKRKLPLVVFEDYPKCSKPIIHNISKDHYMMNKNEKSTDITYMMYYCLPHVNKYQHALNFFTRSTCGPLLYGAGNVTPIEINYPDYFNHKSTLYRKLGRNTPDRAGRWNVIHLLSCLRIESINYNDGKELFSRLCSHSKQSSSDTYPTNIFNLDIMVDNITPICRILLSLNYKMLPFFHSNTYDVLKENQMLNQVDDFRDRTRPLYINILIYYRNINNKIRQGNVITTLADDSLLGEEYIAPNIELLDILLDYDIDIDIADIEIDEDRELSPIDFCCFKGYYTCLEVFLQKRPELFKESSHYLKLISDGLKEELKIFFSDENMEQVFNKLKGDSRMRYTELVANILIDNIMDDFNFLQEFLEFDKFSEILDQYGDVKKIDFINTFAMRYLHSMISSFINTYKLIKNKSSMNVFNNSINVFNNSINASQILSKFIDEANYRNITNVTLFKEFVKKWQKYNNNISITNNISDTDLNTLLRNGEPLRKKLDIKLKRVKPLRNIANKKNSANLVSKIPIHVSMTRRVFENTNKTSSLANIVLHKLKIIGESINYRHVTEKTQLSLKVTKKYLSELIVLQSFDRNIVERSETEDGVKEILKHAIKSSNTVVRESSYKAPNAIITDPKIKENFFNTIRTDNGIFSTANQFLKTVLRFQRLSYILCMNSTLLNNVISIDNDTKIVIHWYSFVYNNLVKFATTIKPTSNTNKSLRNPILINQNLKKIEELYHKCISNFTELYNLKPEMELTSYGGSSKKYIKLQKGGKRLIRTGGRGGRYYMKGGNKIYIK